eukprot:TRINITY_DN2064_c0_g1_i3.p2 TRINITY_DN2064_c0_g1~~TRINITY_DN2064_c0_g1_i3.p2  ORF type:complete len:116 (+),score=27.49 TRINITY_DN2064_c0_g1_i3:459-806(+)
MYVGVIPSECASAVDTDRYLMKQGTPFWCIHSNACADTRTASGGAYDRQGTAVRVKSGDTIEVERGGEHGILFKYNSKPYPAEPGFFKVDPAVRLALVVSVIAKSKGMDAAVTVL